MKSQFPGIGACRFLCRYSLNLQRGEETANGISRLQTDWARHGPGPGSSPLGGGRVDNADPGEEGALFALCKDHVIMGR